MSKKLKKIKRGLKYLESKYINTPYSHICKKILPIERQSQMNGVKIPCYEKLPKLKYENFIPFYSHEDDPNYSMSEIKAHQKLTAKGDDIVIVGGGWGVSAVCAARICNPGKVYVFETSSYRVKLIEDVFELNNITNAKVIHGTVGNILEAYSSEKSTLGKNVSVTNLPRHNVLEMDCEGAEYDIVSQLNTLEEMPEVLIIEIHNHPDKKPEFILNKIEELGYDIIYARKSPNAEKLSREELNRVLEKRYNIYKNKTKNKDKPGTPIIGSRLK